ncbi:MOSC domain-containing protein YiiM [Paenibacillus phyllosphaerae]|uniref:MOSC domain-containing protein YiiM n=1 Tax=Paenibacillus phyllosphaerae TaxID=274593 RepID=A0A7W5AX68_9BACL|nr:MOSC domain-containing protein [Paenibacillus phyllosphaerae]MBB3110317.1 MOSC domain-containing protein YiiM [Paenibacillus phyllosphaerae]
MQQIGTLIALNVSKPVKIMHGSKEIETGIFKEPKQGRVYLSKLGLDGDGQADMVHHGGEDKAVCVYSEQHFAYWAEQWGKPVQPGAFGENFTVSRMTEDTLHIGDVLKVGGALLQVSQPRQPCFKLGLKHELPALPAAIQDNGYTGFYLRVLEEGEVEAGDPVFLIDQDQSAVSLQEANRVMHLDKKDVEGIRSLLRLTALSASWQDTLASRLAKLS